LRNNILKINDIWDKNNNTFVDNQTIFNRLDDKRNWISEWAKIKISIPENFVKKLKSDDNEKIIISLGLKIDSNLNIKNHMQTFPLELDNALFTFNLAQYIPN
jgi:hypothetical protein